MLAFLSCSLAGEVLLSTLLSRNEGGDVEAVSLTNVVSVAQSRGTGLVVGGHGALYSMGFHCGRPSTGFQGKSLIIFLPPQSEVL